MSAAGGWWCRVGSAERLEALDAHLWTYRDDAFLPHGMRRDGSEADQPVWLTDRRRTTPTTPTVRFLIDGATPPDLMPYRRGVYMFDGHDDEAIAACARALEGGKGGWPRRDLLAAEFARPLGTQGVSTKKPAGLPPV